MKNKEVFYGRLSKENKAFIKTTANIAGISMNAAVNSLLSEKRMQCLSQKKTSVLASKK